MSNDAMSKFPVVHCTKCGISLTDLNGSLWKRGKLFLTFRPYVVIIVAYVRKHDSGIKKIGTRYLVLGTILWL